MFEFLYPKMYVRSVYHIPYDKLMDKKITGLVFDIDNTLAPFDIERPDDKLMAFLNSLTEKGFEICLVSNNNKKRVNLFNESLRYKTVPKAGKPRLKGIKTALKLIGKSPSEAAFIGDQIFTDVWCGNRAKIYTILVKPIANRDEFVVRLKRGAERIVVRSYLRKRSESNGRI